MQPGDLIGGLRIERLLGRGGMGAVYAAVAPSGERFAVKVPSLDGALAQELFARFEREVRVLGRVPPHPNVLRVHGAGTDRGLVYVVLELVPGESLDRVLARSGSLPIERALDATEQLARALAHVHAHGLVHRDVKPANVMLRADGSVVLMDFGLVRDAGAAARLTRSGVIVGTPAYAAPEQLEQGHSVDARADVYGAGAVLHELLTGQPPFSGATQLEVVKRVLVDPPAPLERLRPEVPSAVAAVVRRAMAKRPEDRYATALDLAEDVARARAGERVAAEAHARTRGRSLRLVASALVLAALVSGGAVGGIAARRAGEQWASEVAAAHRASASVRDALRRTRVGLAPAPEAAAIDSVATVLERLARDGRARFGGATARSQLSGAQALVAAARSEGAVERACARDDAPAARAALASVPAGTEATYLVALVALAEADGERARAQLLSIPAADLARDERFAFEVGFGLALADLKRGRTDDALVAVATLEARRAALAKTDASGEWAAARTGLDRIAAAAHLSLGERALRAARFEEARRHRDDSVRLDPASRLATHRALLDAVLSTPRAREREGARFIVEAFEQEPAAFERESYARHLLDALGAALARDDELTALRLFRAARRADEKLWAPPELDVKTTQRAYTILEAQPEAWLELWLESIRAGAGAAPYPTRDALAKFKGSEGLIARLEEVAAASPHDWAPHFPAAFVGANLIDDVRNDLATRRRWAERVELHARAVLAASHVPPTVRGLARGCLARAAIELTRVDDAIAETKTAIDEGHPRPDDAAQELAQGLLRARRFEDARAWAQRGVELADDRAARYARGPEALREGRRPGAGLEAPGAGYEYLSRVNARGLLANVLVASGRNDDARRVLDEQRRLDEGDVLSRIDEAVFLIATGEPSAARPVLEEARRRRDLLRPEDPHRATRGQLFDAEVRAAILFQVAKKKPELDAFVRELERAFPEVRRR